MLSVRPLLLLALERDKPRPNLLLCTTIRRNRLCPRCRGGTGNSSPMVYRCGKTTSNGKKKRRGGKRHHRVEGDEGACLPTSPIAVYFVEFFRASNIFPVPILALVLREVDCCCSPACTARAWLSASRVAPSVVNVVPNFTTRLRVMLVELGWLGPNRHARGERRKASQSQSVVVFCWFCPRYWG